MTNTTELAAVETVTWITLDHAAVLAGYSTRTLQTMIKTGRAPAPHKFSARRVRYSETEFRAWLAVRVEAARVAGAGEIA